MTDRPSTPIAIVWWFTILFVITTLWIMRLDDRIDHLEHPTTNAHNVQPWS